MEKNNDKLTNHDKETINIYVKMLPSIHLKKAILKSKFIIELIKSRLKILDKNK